MTFRGFASCLAALALLASACSAGSGTSPSASLPPNQDGFLFRQGSEVLFIRWDARGGASEGSLDWLHGSSQKITASFTVQSTVGGFSFSFPAGSLAGWTGTFAGDGLSLVIPGDTGGLRQLTLAPATSEDYAQAVARLE